jgi:hypothetical protein
MLLFKVTHKIGENIAWSVLNFKRLWNWIGLTRWGQHCHSSIACGKSSSLCVNTPQDIAAAGSLERVTRLCYVLRSLKAGMPYRRRTVFIPLPGLLPQWQKNTLYEGLDLIAHLFWLCSVCLNAP